MKRIIFYTILSALCLPLFAADDIVCVATTYEYISDNARETPVEAERTAIERAKQKALEEKFGVDVSAITNTLITNRSDADAQSQTNVFSFGGTAVRGEWIETTTEKVLEKTFVDGFWHVKVRVEGKARNYTAEKTDIRYTFVRDEQDVEPPVSFRDGNDLFLRFSSPVAGALCVYLVDEEQNAFCLLPYPSQPTGCQSIEANKDYIFFSEKYDRSAQEYTVNTERESEQNVLYVIFSPNAFSKANDRPSGVNWRNEQMPRQLLYEDLLKWLSRNQTKDPAMVVKREIITIRK